MKISTIPVFICLLLLCCACSANTASTPSPSPASASVAASGTSDAGKQTSTDATNTPSSTAVATATGTAIRPPAQTAMPVQTSAPVLPPGAAATSAPAQTPQSEATPIATAARKDNKLYDPSIFVIQGEGSWRQEIAPNYFADYEADIYLHKIDENDNRAVAGSYQGVFWMKVTINADEWIKDMIGDAPVQIDFAAGGEAICDTLAISLNTTDDKAWVNYNITDDNGNPLPLTQDTPVGKGSFVTVSKDVYLEAKARGAQGEKIDYENQAAGVLTDVNYVIHVQPDSMESGTERKVVMQFTVPGAPPMTMNGTMRRLSGYREDVSDYLNSDEYQQAARKHLGE